MTFLSEYINFSSKDLLDLFLVFILFYYILQTVWRTTAFPVLIALMVILFVTVVSTYMNLQTFSFVVGKIASILLVVVAILFPSEVRRGLYRLGQILPSAQEAQVEEDSLDKICSVVETFAKEKIGALIVFRNTDELLDLINNGRQIGAEISAEIIYSIFHKNSPLHDGAVVIEKNKIVSAACYIPTITTEDTIDRNMGTRHRAAIGFSQQSDAVIVVVSEERGHISLAFGGKMETKLTKKVLYERLSEYLLGKSEND